MRHDLDTSVLDRMLKGHWQILHDDFVHQLRKHLAQRDTLVAYATSDIDEKRPIRLEALRLVLVRVDVKPCGHAHPLHGHVLIEVLEVFRLSLYPYECGQLRIVPLLQRRLGDIGNILIFVLDQKIGQSLNGWPNAIKATSVSDLEQGTI